MSTRLFAATAAAASLFGLAAIAQTTQPTPVQPAPSATTQPGVRAVDPTTVAVTFYTVMPADMLAENLIDADVYNLQNEEVGEIEDLIIDAGKTVRAVVIGVGGFLGMGERRVAVDPGSLIINRGANGEIARVVINTSRDSLKNAPEFKFEGNMRRTD